MRRHENRRGAKVAGEAAPEGVEPRKEFVGECRRVCPPGRQHSMSRQGQWHGDSPGSEAVSSLTLRARGNQGDPTAGLREVGTDEQV